MAEFNPNAVTGLASNLNIKEIVERFVAIEQRKAKPIEGRKEQKLKELESWDAVKVETEKLHEVSKTLAVRDIWEAKRADSSHPDVVGVTAKRSAKPGKHTLAVDAVALAHQITSQGFASPDDNVGTGVFKIQVGTEEDRAPIEIRVNDTNNTLEGIKQAINDEDYEVEAFVVRTGAAEKPYQLLLTSKLTGEEGRITVEVNLRNGEVEPPRYENTHETDPEWFGLDPTEPSTPVRGKGASTPIVGSDGLYTGEEDSTYTFTVVQAGTISSEEGVVIQWRDEFGDGGNLELNKFTYVPGSPIELSNGVRVLFSDGEVISGDQFTIEAMSTRSELLWWMSPEERAPKILPPSPWDRQDAEGGISVTGFYTGEVDQTVVFRVEGSGQVGGPKALWLHYEFTETGESGRLNLGFPYQSTPLDPAALESATGFDFVDNEGLFTMMFETAGSSKNKLSIGQGLEVIVPPGILYDGDTAMVDLVPKVSNDLWWLPEDKRGTTGMVDTTAPFEHYLNDDGEPIFRANVRDGILPFNGRKSDADIKVSGEYLDDLPVTYTFTATKDGTVGVTRLLEVRWEDSAGNTGKLDFGEGYEAGKPLPFAAGLEVALDPGRLVKGDLFEVSTKTPTVQKPQDAVVRLGASDLGGGIEVRRPTNKIDDLIEGLELELFKPSEEVVTISVTGDTERAKETVRDFVDAFNTLNATISEVTKFDQATQKAAPLLSDRNVATLSNKVANTTITAVPGLPASHKMLFSVGLRVNDKGFMEFDESKLDSKISEDFAAVANIFRSNGISDNTQVDFLGVSNQTKPNPNGFVVDVTQAATPGTYLTPPMPPMINITARNNQFIVESGGRKSEPIVLRENMYNPASLAREIQSKIQDDNVLGKRRIRVMAEEDGRLKFVNGLFGASSTLSIKPVPDEDIDIGGLGLLDGISTAGKDVAGTIDGVDGEGRGQLLVGAKGSNADGLRLFVTMPEDKTGVGAEARVKVTKGVAVLLDEMLQGVTDPVKGDIKDYISNIAEQVGNYDKQIKRLSERADAKQKELSIKFTNMESKLGKLKAEQNYLGQQFASLSGSNKKD